jgi:hypothetical protein
MGTGFSETAMRERRGPLPAIEAIRTIRFIFKARRWLQSALASPGGGLLQVNSLLIFRTRRRLAHAVV